MKKTNTLFIILLFSLLIFGAYLWLGPENNLGSIKNVFQRREEKKLPAIETVDARGKTGVQEHYIMVKFKPSTSSEKRKEVLKKHKLSERSEITQLKVKLLTISDEDTPEEARDRLEAEEKNFIEFAEVDEILAPSLVPNDPWFPNWQKDKQIINAPGAWDTTTGNANLVSAVADTGVDCSHEDLTINCVSGWNFYDNNSNTNDVFGHGTKVAGIIGALGNNSIGIAGAVWQSKIMPIRVSDANGLSTLSAIANAITYAADHGAKTVNASYAAGGSKTVQSAGNYMRSRGGLVTISAGNSGKTTGNSASPDLIVVSATDSSDTLYSWSSFGNDVDISAPGCTGAATINGGGYTSFCGTSNSAPEAAGVLMLIWSANPALSPDQAQNALFSSAKDLGPAGWDEYYGWGRINAYSALIQAQNTASVPLPPPPAASVSDFSITNFSVSEKTNTSAKIFWKTNISSTGSVSYGASAASLSFSITDNTVSTEHSALLSNLSPNTKYYYQITASSEDVIKSAVSSVSTFRTRAK